MRLGWYTARLRTEEVNEKGSSRVARAFVDSCFTGDLDKTMSYLAEDVRWWNVLMQPIQGQAKSREFLAPLVRKDPLVVPFTFRTEVKQTLADGDNVVIERVDHFDMGQFQPVDTLIQSLVKKK